LGRRSLNQFEKHLLFATTTCRLQSGERRSTRWRRQGRECETSERLPAPEASGAARSLPPCFDRSTRNSGRGCSLAE